MDIQRSPNLLVGGGLALAMLQIVSLYNGAAPTLKELREAPTDDTTTQESLMDADILIGGSTVIVIIIAMWATRSAWPLLLLGSGLLFTMGWHHLVRRTPNLLERGF